MIGNVMRTTYGNLWRSAGLRAEQWLTSMRIDLPLQSFCVLLQAPLPLLLGMHKTVQELFHRGFHRRARLVHAEIRGKRMTADEL